MDCIRSLLYDWKTLVASLVAISFATVHIYFKFHHNYWKKRGCPEIPVEPVPFFGHLFKLLMGQCNFTDAFEALYRAAGDRPYAGVFLGTKPGILVKDPELIKQILVKDFHVFINRALVANEDVDPINAKGLFSLKGQRWKEMRARLSPTFTSGRMKAMFPLMHACVDDLIKCLTESIEKSEGELNVEIKEVMSCYSTDIIATCAFGIKCDALQHPETSEFRRMGKMVFETTWKRAIVLAFLFICPKALKWMGLKFTENESSIFFGNFVKSMVKQREMEIEKQTGGGSANKFGDFIHHLVMLKKSGLHHKDGSDDDEAQDDDEMNLKLKADISWTNVDDEDLTAQVMLFFSAGFETTSAVLSFALYELSSSENGKEIQRELREEIDRVMEKNGGKITYEGIKRMELLDRVLNEALRLYSPAGVLSRIAVQPYIIPGTTVKIDVDTPVLIPAQSLQLDEKYFPDPKRFDPDRFLPENKDKLKQFSYLPFGEGPRFCIGERFAKLQTQLGLASLISQFEFDLCHNKTSVPLKFKKRSFVLATESGIWLKVRCRQERT